MNQVPVDIDQRRLPRLFVDHVSIPNLFVKCFACHKRAIVAFPSYCNKSNPPPPIALPGSAELCRLDCGSASCFQRLARFLIARVSIRIRHFSARPRQRRIPRRPPSLRLKSNLLSRHITSFATP